MEIGRPLRGGDVNVNDLLEEMGTTLSSGNCQGISSITIYKALFPQFEILLELARARQQARQRTDNIETRENSVGKPESAARKEDVEEDNPQEPCRDGDCLEKQVKENETTAREGDAEDDNPQDVGKEEGCLERQMQESRRTTDEDVEEKMEDEDPQELSGSPEVRTEQSAYENGDGATRYRHLDDETRAFGGLDSDAGRESEGQTKSGA